MRGVLLRSGKYQIGVSLWPVPAILVPARVVWLGPTTALAALAGRSAVRGSATIDLLCDVSRDESILRCRSAVVLPGVAPCLVRASTEAGRECGCDETEPYSEATDAGRLTDVMDTIGCVWPVWEAPALAALAGLAIGRLLVSARRGNDPLTSASALIVGVSVLNGTMPPYTGDCGSGRTMGTPCGSVAWLACWMPAFPLRVCPVVTRCTRGGSATPNRFCTSAGPLDRVLRLVSAILSDIFK